MRASMKWDQGNFPETDIQYSSAPIRRYLMRERTADVHTGAGCDLCGTSGAIENV